jgi:hypothetical protein
MTRAPVFVTADRVWFKTRALKRGPVEDNHEPLDASETVDGLHVYTELVGIQRPTMAVVSRFRIPSGAVFRHGPLGTYFLGRSLFARIDLATGKRAVIDADWKARGLDLRRADLLATSDGLFAVSGATGTDRLESNPRPSTRRSTSSRAWNDSPLP